MSMFKITIEKITKTEYPEKETVYEASDGKRYYSKYSISENVKYEEIERETGKILIREDEEKIYIQRTEKEIDIKKVIDSFNQ